MQKEAKHDGAMNEFLNEIKEENKYEIIKDVLMLDNFNFIVTPKEIDELIENMTKIVADGINGGL